MACLPLADARQHEHLAHFVVRFPCDELAHSVLERLWLRQERVRWQLVDFADENAVFHRQVDPVFVARSERDSGRRHDLGQRAVEQLEFDAEQWRCRVGCVGHRSHVAFLLGERDFPKAHARILLVTAVLAPAKSHH